MLDAASTIAGGTPRRARRVNRHSAKIITSAPPAIASMKRQDCTEARSCESVVITPPNAEYGMLMAV